MNISLPVTLLPSSLTSTVNDLRDQLETTSVEAVTGQYSDLTSHLSGRIGTAMLNQKALDDITNERTQLSLRAGRLEIVQNSLSVVAEEISGLSLSMQSALGTDDQTTRDAVAMEAKSALEQTFTALNTRYGERYLFSGDATSTTPFGDVDTLLDDIRDIANNATDADDFATQLDAYFNTADSGWQANVYAGTETASDSDAVTGMDPAIIDIVSSLAVMALSGSDEGIALFEGDSEAVQTAADTLSSGQAGLTSMQATLGTAQAKIETQQEMLDTEETILTTSFNALTARDQYEAASELTQLETTLEAAYTLTSKLANLSLLNYLE